jgi:Methyltransferase domain
LASIRLRAASPWRDDLAGNYGTFPLVVSLEVIEHCFDPRAFARTFLSLIAPDGVGFLSTPYHSYLKNLALAVSGKMESHFTALWDGGHVKFFAIKTLRTEVGAKDVSFLRVDPFWPNPWLPLFTIQTDLLPKLLLEKFAETSILFFLDRRVLGRLRALRRHRGDRQGGLGIRVAAEQDY